MGEQVPYRMHGSPVADYLFATAVTLTAFAVAFIADRYLSIANLSLILLTAVLAVAVRKRMAVAVYTAVLCFLGDNFFFTRPRHTLAIANADDVLAIVLFLIVALVCSRMATRLSSQVASLRIAQLRARTLLQLGKQLAAAADAAAIREIGALALTRAAGVTVSMRTVEPASADSASSLEPSSDRDDQWVIPLIIGTHDHGEMVFERASSIEPDTDRRELALAMTQDIALALERTRLAEELEQARVQGETERLRNALLSSVSHDLRSPLASMIGAADTLAMYQAQLPHDEQQQLLQAILHEGQRLDRYIQNLLDMTRLGHGTLKLHRDWVDATEVVVAATDRLRRFFPELILQTELPHDTVLLYVHPALIEQALFNVLENAAHFSPPDGAVRVTVNVVGEQLLIEVIDHGPGIPPDERARIFDMFYSVSRGDRGNKGTGLGLSICRGMIGAHGGSVEALPGEDGGTIIRITLPLPPPPETSA
ncbi:ATP-binding protein [Rhodanobacter sp. AS-Z3]|uniref:sensor histidine kinase n=1 Tax=Rhodanobacter sp. AS-Z3 TaxID=3031330 RepID=UPI0024792239|nr:ATP-binding protein [Rhodanobacter sp. AS-Z3]WEN14900.1 ATP-binding protein [Rhodanobacter sp. AS-Z3]